MSLEAAPRPAGEDLRGGLVALLDSALGSAIDPESLPKLSFIGLGGDSLAAMRFVALAQDRFGLRVPVSSLLDDTPLERILVELVSGTRVADAPSGFRAFSRDAALRLNVFSKYTYTLETIIQAGQKNFVVESVPIRVNHELRPSRLVRSIPDYVRKSMLTIVRMFVVYRPFRFFMAIGALLFLGGLAVSGRFLYYFLMGAGTGKVQSLILAAVLLMMGFHTMLLAFVTDLLSVNRRLLEELQAYQRESRLRESSAAEQLGAVLHTSFLAEAPPEEGALAVEPATPGRS
jgi:acyl carrier protein